MFKEITNGKHDFVLEFIKGFDIFRFIWNFFPQKIFFEA